MVPGGASSPRPQQRLPVTVTVLMAVSADTCVSDLRDSDSPFCLGCVGVMFKMPVFVSCAYTCEYYTDLELRPVDARIHVLFLKMYL